MEDAASQLEAKKDRFRSFFAFVGPWLIILAVGYWWFKRMEPPPPAMPADYAQVKGARLMYRYQCGRCHTVALPGMEGKMGPPLRGLRDRAYIEESLRNPGKQVKHGYINAMPSFNQLPAAEITELVEYVSSL
ncbi:MAG: cytochrome c [Vulcanimicrobiota bacterium]